VRCCAALCLNLNLALLQFQDSRLIIQIAKGSLNLGADAKINTQNLPADVIAELDALSGQPFSEDDMDPKAVATSIAEDSFLKRNCGSCQKDLRVKAARHRCAGCKTVNYCDVECQTRDWHIHKLCCKALAKKL
jgi:hypothetical protein